MKLMRYIGAASVAGALSLAMAGAAFAADASIDTTGPNSTQTVKIDSSSTIDTTNNNDVQVVNVNEQKAETGDVAANKNTTVSGGLGSGEATNNAAASTTVTIGNEAVGSGSTNPPVGGTGGGGSTPGSGGGSSAAPGQGGGALGAETAAPGMGAGEAILPVTGATVPVDVSALRAAWHAPQNSAAAKQLVKQTQMFTTGMLVLAALLSLAGAVASAIYARRREGRV